MTMITDSNRGEGGKTTVMLMITDSNIQTEVKEEDDSHAHDH